MNVAAAKIAVAHGAEGIAEAAMRLAQGRGMRLAAITVGVPRWLSGEDVGTEVRDALLRLGLDDVEIGIVIGGTRLRLDSLEFER